MSRKMVAKSYTLIGELNVPACHYREGKSLAGVESREEVVSECGCVARLHTSVMLQDSDGGVNGPR